MGFGTLEGVVSRIPSGRSLGLGHSNVSGALTLWAMLIYLSEDRRRLKAVNRFLRLVHPNCLASSCVVLSEPGLESFLKQSNEIGLFWGPISIRLDKDELEMKEDAQSWISSQWH